MLPVSTLTTVILAVSGAGIVGIGLLEVVLRVGLLEYYPRVRNLNPETTMRATVDSSVGWTAPSGAEYEERREPGESWKRHTIDEDGFRNAYDSNGSRTALVFGDSMTYGSLVNDWETYPYQLNDRLEDWGVHNFGVVSYGISQSALLYERVSDRIEHECVILGYYLGNDAMENVDDHPLRPKFELVDGEAVVVESPTEGGFSSSKWAVRLQESLYDHLHLYRALRPRVEKVFTRRQQPAQDGQLTDVGERALSVTEAILSQFVELAGENDALMIIVEIPHRSEFVSPGKTDGEYTQRTFWSHQRWMLRKVEEEWDHVTVVPLMEPIRSAMHTRALYGTDDPHLTSDGHELIASELESHIDQLGNNWPN